MKYVRIGNNVWEVSPSDLRSYGHDSYALRMRAKSARIAFTQVSGEWFRSGSSLRTDDSTAVTKGELKKIQGSIPLKEPT